ncbi:MAG: right-handed parallel beta-helix repeat-containing protein [Fimbriimonas sp.]
MALLVIPAVTVHVSSTGVDTQVGSAKAPVRRLERALEIVRQRPSGAAARIVLGKGDYSVRDTIELQARDGNLTIDGGGKARILGGKAVGGWQPVTDEEILARLTPEARERVRVTDLAQIGLTAGELRLRGFHDGKPASALEVFFDGQPMQIARWPNAGNWAKIAAKAGERSFTYEGDRPKAWKTPNDPWIFGYLRLDWCDTYDRAVNLDLETRTVELSREPDYGIEAKRRFYFFNILEELDIPGEHFVDRRAGKLYFWPPKPLPAADVVASLIEGPMFRLKGASNVRLTGLQLEAGRDGAVWIEGGEGNRVESCLIRNFGTYGVSIHDAKNSGVSHCDLTGLGSRGIELFGGDRKTLIPAGLYAEDNHIWAYSRWPRTYQAGIAIEGVGARVANNLIEDAPHNAILLSGNDHVLEYNDIRRVCLETGDSGAVYMGHNLTMRGHQIRFNRFRDIVPTVNTEGAFTTVMSVYLDDQWCGTTIFGNVFEGKGTGILIGGGRDNTVENNVFVGKDPAFHIDQRGKDWAKDKEKGFIAQVVELNATKPPYSTRYPQLATLLDGDVMLATGNAFVRNVVAGKRPFWFQDGLTEKSMDYRENVLLEDTPLGDALKKAPKGFRPIPLAKIGLTRKARPFGGAR